ncbi:MAG: hypothetical protein HWN66_16955 [Candidatus Helarchaeota archaeon]|nr:hypothetical protein [Candidatus Helarchaeota archaeon]
MKKKLIITCLCLSFLLGFLIQPTSATNDPFEVVSVDRTIHITYHKLFRVTDEYTFINTGGDPLSSLIIAVPYQFTSNIASFDLFGNESEKLSFEKLPYDGSNLIKWRVYLDNPLFGGDTAWIQNNITFIGLTTDTSQTFGTGKQGHINFAFVKFPSSPYDIRNCSVTITCDPKVSIYDPVGNTYSSTLVLGSNITIPKYNITPYSSRYNLTDHHLAYDFYLSAIKFPYIKRELQIDLWGYIYVTEEHFIENFGPVGRFRIDVYSFDIPSEAENLNVYDKYGALRYSRSGEDLETVSVNFDATRYTLQYGESTIYWVTYRIPLLNHGQRAGDKIKLELDILFGEFDCLVENYEITLILPKDASVNYISPSVDSINTVDNNLILIYNEFNITPSNSKVIELEIDISKSYFHFLARPLFFILVLGVICTCYVMFKRVLPFKERLFERATVVPTPILLEFCSLFEEKISLITEIEKLDDNLKKRKIKKRIYRNQRKTAERKILELNKDIDELKVTLRNAGGRFAQVINELEINEAERQSAKDGLYNLEQRYLRKKISVVAYQKLTKDLYNRHKKAKTKIDKLLFELREILS